MGFLYHVPQAVPGRPQAAWESGVIPSVTPWVTDGELRPPGPRREAWRQNSTSCPQRGVLQQEGGEGPQLTGSGQLGLEAGWGSCPRESCREGDTAALSSDSASMYCLDSRRLGGNWQDNC